MCVVSKAPATSCAAATAQALHPPVGRCWCRAGLQAAAGSPDKLREGFLQRFSTVLLQHVPFDTLEAQVRVETVWTWPHECLLLRATVLAVPLPQPTVAHHIPVMSTCCRPAQIWPRLPAAQPWPAHMPPLLSPKVVRVARLLDEKCAAAGRGADWSAIVFVETKVRL
jgi:hypothetical protein